MIDIRKNAIRIALFDILVSGSFCSSGLLCLNDCAWSFLYMYTEVKFGPFEIFYS